MESVLFCPRCHSILALADADTTKCVACGKEISFVGYRGQVTVSHVMHTDDGGWMDVRVANDATENKLFADMHGGVKEESKAVGTATVKEECPKCGHDEAAFTTAQLRSADEGSTVFYKCLKCAHMFSANN